MPSVIEWSKFENKADSESKASLRSQKNEENKFWMAASRRRQVRARRGKSDVRERPASKCHGARWAMRAISSLKNHAKKSEAS